MPFEKSSMGNEAGKRRRNLNTYLAGAAAVALAAGVYFASDDASQQPAPSNHTIGVDMGDSNKFRDFENTVNYIDEMHVHYCCDSSYTMKSTGSSPTHSDTIDSVVKNNPQPLPQGKGDPQTKQNPYQQPQKQYQSDTVSSPADTICKSYGTVRGDL